MKEAVRPQVSYYIEWRSLNPTLSQYLTSSQKGKKCLHQKDGTDGCIFVRIRSIRSLEAGLSKYHGADGYILDFDISSFFYPVSSLCFKYVIFFLSTFNRLTRERLNVNHNGCKHPDQISGWFLLLLLPCHYHYCLTVCRVLLPPLSFVSAILVGIEFSQRILTVWT